MQTDKMIAVIPARGGSKGVKGKNIRRIAGKPLIGYSIEAALQSRLFTRVVVSTDDSTISETARSLGAEVPFVRPPEISGDLATSDAVVRHALDFYRERGEEFDIVCKLQPTSPLRSDRHIREALSLMQEKDADFVVSVCPCEHSPLWTGTLDDSLSMNEFMSGVDKNAGRQTLPTYYRLNGAIYMGRVQRFLENGSFIGKNGFAYIMGQEESVDIDSELDLRLAELIMEEKNAIS